VAIDLAGPAGLVLLVVVATIASVVNTMAGGGGLLVLPTLMALGLGPMAANGTMRVGVLAQNVTSVLAFRREGLGDLRLVARLLPAMIVGAGAGAWLATELDEALLRPLFGVVLVLWAVALLLRPARFFSVPEAPLEPGWGSHVASLAIGAYGGFLQVGVGFPLLALLVTGLGHAPVRANAIKVALVLGFTLVSLSMFASAGQVLWREGVALAIGGAIGGWIGAAWQVRAGAEIVRWFVIVTVAVSGAAMLLRAI
jgi:uncharacterized membrane protein YfcA